MAYSKDRGDAPMRRRGGRRRKKVCIFCADKNAVIDYKDVNKLKRYVSERGKILPRSPSRKNKRRYFPVCIRTISGRKI